jgi:hypothetical protein
MMYLLKVYALATVLVFSAFSVVYLPIASLMAVRLALQETRRRRNTAATGAICRDTKGS